jgi:hypothetical protein
MKTNRGESDDKFGGVHGGNVGDELCYFWCADAVYGRTEYKLFVPLGRRDIRFRETNLWWLPWFMICDHVGLYHQCQVSTLLAHFLYGGIGDFETRAK